MANDIHDGRWPGYNSTANEGLDEMQTQRGTEVGDGAGELHHALIRDAATDSGMILPARNLPTKVLG